MGDNYIAVGDGGRIQHRHQEQPPYKRCKPVCEYYTGNIKYVALYKIITCAMFIFQIIFLMKFTSHASAVRQNGDKQLLFLPACDCCSNTPINGTIGDLYHDAYFSDPLSGVVGGVIMKTIVFAINFIVDIIIFFKLESVSMSTQWTLPKDKDCSKFAVCKNITVLFFSLMSVGLACSSSFPGNYEATYQYSTKQMKMHIVGSVWYYDCQDGYVPIVCEGNYPVCDETCSVLVDSIASTASPVNIYCVNMTHVGEYGYSAYRTVIDSVNLAIFSMPSINISSLCDIIGDIIGFFIMCFCHCM